MPIHLLIDGTDFSGKTSLANNYMSGSIETYQVNYSTLTQNNLIFNFAKKCSDSGMFDSSVTGKLYLASIIYDVLTFKDTGVQIIQDSTVVTKSLAYHLARGTPYIIDELKELLLKYPKPLYSVYLYADMPTRLERLEKRMKETPEKVTPSDLTLLSNPPLFEQQEEILAQISREYFNSTFLDTSKLSEDEVVKAVRIITSENIF